MKICPYQKHTFKLHILDRLKEKQKHWEKDKLTNIDVLKLFLYVEHSQLIWTAPLSHGCFN